MTHVLRFAVPMKGQMDDFELQNICDWNTVLQGYNILC